MRHRLASQQHLRWLTFKWLAMGVGSLVAATLGASLAIVIGAGGSAPTKVIVEAPPPTNPAALTLVEAWDTALAQASAWEGRWVLTAIRSNDVGDRPSQADGADGRRRTWQADFSAETGMIRWMRITGGKVTNVIEPTVGASKPTSLVALPKPLMDSSDAVQIARRGRPVFSGGASGKSIGYHFAYGDQVLPGLSVLSVTGEAGGKLARVAIDIEQKAVVVAQRMESNGGDLFVSWDGGLNWRRSALSGTVRGVGADVKGGGAVAYAVVDLGDGPAVWRSSDEAATWARLAPLPDSLQPLQGMLAVLELRGSIRVLFGTTSEGMWSFDTGTSRFEREASPGDIRDLSVDGDGRANGVFKVGSQHKHFVLGSVGTWTPVGAESAVRLGRGGGPVDGFDPDLPYKGLQNVLAVARSGTTVFASDRDQIRRSQDGGVTWETSQIGLTADILLAPNFDETGTALAVLHPGVISRSADRGGTWSQVLRLDSRNYGRLVFLSKSTVVIPTIGEFRWTDF